MSFIALCHTTLKLSNTAQISVFKSVFVPILIFGHEFYVMTEIVLSQVQEVEMGFLQRVHGVTLHDKVRIYEIRKTLNVKTLFE